MFSAELAATRSLFLSSLFFVAVSSPVIAADKEDAASLPSSPLVKILHHVPTDIESEDFTKAYSPRDAANWSAWTLKLNELFKKLYTDLTDEERATTIKEVEKRLAEVSKSLGDSRYEAVRPAFAEFSRRYSRRLDLMKAVDAVLKADRPALLTAYLDKLSQRLGTKVAELETFLQSTNGLAWMEYVRVGELKKALQSKDALEAAVRATVEKLRSSDSLPAGPQKTYLTSAQFKALELEGSHYLIVKEAQSKPISAEKLTEDLTSFVSAVENYEETRHAASATLVANGLKNLKLAVGYSVEAVDKLESNYVNYNFRVLAPQGFLNRLVARQEGPTTSSSRPNVAGASVSLTSTTTVTTSLALENNRVPNTLSLALVLNGLVTTQMTSSSSERGITGTAQFSGNHPFSARKEVVLSKDGAQISPSVINVQANHVLVSSGTDAGFLAAGTANSVAQGRAQGSIPQANATTEAEIRSRLQREFEPQADEALRSLDKKIRESRAKFTKNGLESSRTFAASNVGFIVDNELYRNASELGADAPSPTPISNNTLVLQIHESLLNNTIDKAGFAGKSFTELEMITEIEKFFKDLLGDTFSMGKTKKVAEDRKSEDKIELNQADPIRFRFANNTFYIIYQARYTQANGNTIGLKRVTVPMEVSMDRSKIYQKRGNVVVESLDETGGLSENAPIRRKYVTLIQDDEASRIQKFEDEKKKNSVSITVQKLLLADGWLTLEVQ